MRRVPPLSRQQAALRADARLDEATRPPETLAQVIGPIVRDSVAPCSAQQAGFRQAGRAPVPPRRRKPASLPRELADASPLLLAAHRGHGRIVGADTRDFCGHRRLQRKPLKSLRAGTP